VTNIPDLSPKFPEPGDQVPFESLEVVRLVIERNLWPEMYRMLSDGIGRRLMDGGHIVDISRIVSKHELGASWPCGLRVEIKIQKSPF